MGTASTRLLDVLRASQGNCTDYRAGKLLGVTTATVSRWRTGAGHMSTANVQRACELAGIPDQTWEWNLRIGAERERGPDGDLYRQAVADLERVRQGQEPSECGLFALLTRGVRAAAILTAMVFAWGHANIAEARSAAPSSAELAAQECILCNILD